MQNRRLNNAELWTILILFLAFLFGGVVRFTPAIFSDFPINDGGLFYVMTDELRDNHYRIPAATHYNGLSIPYVYPPLGFYLGGLAADLFRVDLLDIFLWFPAVVSTLSLAAFYLLARSLLDSAPAGALATLIFALIPRSITWFLMGGGVTRSLGQLFLLLTIYTVYMTLARGSRRHLWLSMLFGGLACLSHPEAIIHAGASCFLLVLFYVRSRRGIFDAALIALGVLGISSPWWLTVLLRDGLAPFLTASQTGMHSPLALLPIILPVFAEENFITILTILGLVGLGAEAFRRRFFLPVWLIFPMLVEPRSAASIAIVPLALLAAIALTDVILPAFLSFSRKENAASSSWNWIEVGLKNNVARIVLGYVAIVALISSFSFALALSSFHASREDRAAIAWIRENTPPESRFLVISGSTEPLSDPVQEWFPALSSRVSQSTIQGWEWLDAGRFALLLSEELSNLQKCVNRRADCLQSWAEANDRPFEYVFIERYRTIASFKPELPAELPALLLTSLQDSPDYEMVYESESVLIFAYLQARQASP